MRVPRFRIHGWYFLALDDENESSIRPRRRSFDRDELLPHSFELVRVRNFVQRCHVSIIGHVWNVHFVLVRIGVFAAQVGVDHRKQVAGVVRSVRTPRYFF